MLVTVDELTTYMDIKFSNRQTRASEYVLAGLQSELESFLRRPIEVGTYVSEEHVIAPDFASMPTASHMYDYTLDTTGNVPGYVQPAVTIYARNSPIISVASVYISAATGASLQLTEGIDYIVQRYGVDLYRAIPNDRIKITYTAGLDGPEIPFFRLLILRILFLSVLFLNNFASEYFSSNTLSKSTIPQRVLYLRVLFLKYFSSEYNF
jgi:hypothetical protein